MSVVVDWKKNAFPLEKNIVNNIVEVILLIMKTYCVYGNRWNSKQTRLNHNRDHSNGIKNLYIWQINHGYGYNII